MFFFIIQILLIIYIIFSVYSIIEIQKYNKNGFITEIKSFSNIKYELSLLNPILTKFSCPINLDHLNQNYSNKLFKDNSKTYSISKINDLSECNIFKNTDLIEKSDIKDKINFDLSIFEDFPIPLLLYKKYSLSFFKGNNITEKIFCKHNINLIYIITGNTTIYLFNPKHKKEILNKDLQSIKKYSHKYVLKENDLLLIPPNWYYIQEINNNLNNDINIQYHIDMSNIFTCHYNYLR
jgi:hypothetical protein